MIEGGGMEIERYLETYKRKQVNEKSSNTVEAYIRDIKQFISFKDIEKATTEDVENFKKLLLSRNIKPKSINRKLVSVRQFIEYLNRLEDFEPKIFLEIKLIKIQRQEYLEEILSKSDFDRLVRAAEKENDKRAVAIFETLYLTGARVSELLQFNVEDVKKNSKMISGKGSKYRELFMPEALQDYLSDYAKARRIESGKLFLNVNNDKTMDRQSVHNLIKKYAGISKVKLSKAHAHNFRHLYCFKLREMGLSLDEIADLAGHSDINTTKIYTRRTKPELMNMIRKLN